MNQQTQVFILVPSQVRFSAALSAVVLEVASLAQKKLVAAVDTVVVEQPVILQIIEHIQSISPVHSSLQEIDAPSVLLFLFKTFTHSTMLEAIFKARSLCCPQQWLGQYFMEITPVRKSIERLAWEDRSEDCLIGGIRGHLCSGLRA